MRSDIRKFSAEIHRNNIAYGVVQVAHLEYLLGRLGLRDELMGSTQVIHAYSTKYS
jgi:hypothetical protein